ncbi:MAG TPA: hypothetical protein VGJ20_36605 [Xanthobacteraceae bacterium]
MFDLERQWPGFLRVKQGKTSMKTLTVIVMAAALAMAASLAFGQTTDHGRNAATNRHAPRTGSASNTQKILRHQKGYQMRQ